MKRILIVSAALVILVAVWYGESRRFFCVSDDKCVTVWKTYGNLCYIIPGKYYGILRPSDNFIKTSNTNNLTIYFSNEIPNGLVYKSENELTIINEKENKFIFYDYTSDTKKYDKILYIPNAVKSNDIKVDADLIYIFIKENFALGKNGKRL